jgi:hypothetical protein
MVDVDAVKHMGHGFLDPAVDVLPALTLNLLPGEGLNERDDNGLRYKILFATRS